MSLIKKDSGEIVVILEKIGILCLDIEHFALKMSLFFHDPEMEDFGDPDSIASNATFSLVCKCNKNI